MENSRPSFFWPLLLSLLLIHVPLVFLFFFMANQPIAPLSIAQDNAVKPILIDLKTLPIVDVAVPEKDEVPDEAHAWAEHNVKVKEETVNALPNKPQQRPAQSVPQTKPPQQSQKTEPKNSNPAPSSLSEILSELDQKQKKAEQDFDQKFKSQTPAPDPQPVKGQFGQGSYEPFYKLGNKTYVNALAHPHVGYYIQINRKYDIAWNPEAALRGQRRNVPGNTIFCVWGLTISPTGQLLDLQLITPSPVAAYDNEVKRTIQVSAPFGPPPPELYAGEPNLNVAWKFIVYYQ